MKTVLRRLLCALLTLCLLCPAALAESAAAVQDIQARYMFTRRNTLHALDYNGLMYRHGAEGWLPSGGLYDDIWAVDSDGEDVWLVARLENDGGSWYELRQANFDGQGALTGSETLCAIDWRVDGDSWPQFCGLVVDGDAAYLAVSSEDWSSRDLYRVDLTSGKASLILTDTLSTVLRYKDGLLLAQRSNWQREDDMRPEILVIDPTDGRVEVIGSMTAPGDGGLAYDPISDAAYFSNPSYVYRVNGDAPEPVGYLAMSGADGGNHPAVIHEGRYDIHTYRGLASAALDPGLLPKRALRVQRETALIEEQVMAFAKLRPDIAIEYVSDSYRGLDDFVRAMQGENAPDVFLTNLNPDFITLRDRKYLADLSASEALLNAVRRMAPNLTRDILADGKLYAVPCALNVSMNSYFPLALAKAGLTAEDVPASYEGMLDFIERWHDAYWEDNEGMQFFEWCYDLRRFLFDQICETQLRACQADGHLTLDTPAFRKLLARLEELAPVISEIAPPMSDEDFEDGFTDNVLFTDMTESLIRGYPLDEYAPRPMPLALDEQSDPVINGFLSLIALNPYSQNADAAMAFIEFVAENLSVTDRIAMMPDEKGPLERTRYEEEMREMRDRYAATEALLADAPEERRADLEDELRYLAYHISDYEENRWAMTEEEIAWYHESILPYIVLTTVSVYSENTAEQLSNLERRYLDGQASLDEFLERYEEIVWMKQQEQ